MSALQALLIFAAGATVISALFLLAPVSRARQDFILLGGGLGLLALILLVGVLLRPARLETAQALTLPPTPTAIVDSIVTLEPTTQDDVELSVTAQPAIMTVEPMPTTVEPTPTTVEPTIAPSANPTIAPSASPTVAPAETATSVDPIPATATPDATDTEASTRTPVSTLIISTVRSQVGNIRDVPRDDGPVIGLVNNGDELIFLGISGDWYLVRLGTDTATASYITGERGWINQLVVEPPSRQPPLVTP